MYEMIDFTKAARQLAVVAVAVAVVQVLAIGGCSYFMRLHFAADQKHLVEVNTPECRYHCPRCGWKPRDDGPMNRADTCEPLVAAMRIDAHECKEK